jgi:hypothetical protein
VDHGALTGYLDTLRTGWDQPSVDGANGVLSHSEYSSADWVQFFSGYFASRTLTQPLYNYIGYPTFSWLSETAHENLQHSLVVVAMPRVQSTIAGHPTDLGPWLVSSTAEREDLVCWLRVLGNLALHSSPSFDRRSLYTWTRDLISSDPRLVATRFTDPTQQPYVNYIRMQLQMILRDAQPLTPQVVAEIASTLGLSGDRLDLWQRHLLLVHDNQFLNVADWMFLRTLWDSIPAGLPKPGNLQVNEALGNSDYTVADTTINIFAIHVPAYSENGFPDEVPPVLASGFGLVAAHELNHVVDCELMCTGRPRLDATLAKRRSALLIDAGNDRNNYLRSVIPDEFFTNAPQEFFASISNMYFASTVATFQVGVARLATGRHQPIEQFLFFLDVYSEGTNTSRGYALDARATLQWYDIPLWRDNQGRVDRFTLPEGMYGVRYDAGGHVASVDRVIVRSRSARH